MQHSLQQWEYKLVWLVMRVEPPSERETIWSNGQIERLLNECGKEGWEMVPYQCPGGYAIFKRALSVFSAPNPRIPGGTIGM